MRTAQVTESGCRTLERSAAVTARPLVYCESDFIFGRGGAALGNSHGSTSASKGVFLVPSVRLTAMVKAAG